MRKHILENHSGCLASVGHNLRCQFYRHFNTFPVTIIICIIKRNLFQLYFSLLHKNCNQQFWLSIHDQFQNIRLPCGSERDSLLISEEIILIASLCFYAYNLSLFQIALKAFGKRFELELNRNLNLVPEKKRLNVFFADQGRESEIQYNPTNLEVSKFFKCSILQSVTGVHIFHACSEYCSSCNYVIFKLYYPYYIRDRFNCIICHFSVFQWDLVSSRQNLHLRQMSDRKFREKWKE